MKARTGEETPPGIMLRASFISLSEFVVVNFVACVRERDGKQQIQSEEPGN